MIQIEQAGTADPQTWKNDTSVCLLTEMHSPSFFLSSLLVHFALGICDAAVKPNRNMQARCHYLIGVTERSKAELEEAVKLYERAAPRDDRYFANALFRLGVLSAGADREMLFKRAYAIAARLKPSDKDLMSQLQSVPQR